MKDIISDDDLATLIREARAERRPDFGMLLLAYELRRELANQRAMRERQRMAFGAQIKAMCAPDVLLAQFKARERRPRAYPSYGARVSLKAKTTHDVTLGVQHPIPGTGVTHIPDSVCYALGIDAPFLAQYLVIACDDVSPEPTLVDVKVGNRSILRRTATPLGARWFAPGVLPRVLLVESVALPESPLLVTVANPADKDVAVRLTLEGEEAPGWDPTQEEAPPVDG